MERYILVEFLNSANTVISQTFKSTQRIKLTSFDISNKYIIFGASSGGIYIFKREPCEFVKLIPSKEASVTKILIAPNEKSIAVATAKGLLLVLENFLELNLRIVTHSQHVDNSITAIKWQGGDVYCGDNTGKISVFSLSDLLTIFHTPSSVIMHLDSSIVQIDTYINYLLISTQSRTYLCDTQKEQFKQIGKKLRDGNFGACFFNTNNSVEQTDIYQHFRGIFRTIKEEDNFVTTLHNECETKIYCARPGARLWEANFEATVLMTYQFRESLIQNPSDLMYIENDLDAKLKITTFGDSEKVSSSFNFGKIYPIYNRFILTYDAGGIYFFDPKTSSLMFWINTFKDITDIKILNSVIYVWQGNLEVNIISLVLLEDLIIKVLLNKQYYLCGELCAHYHEEVISLVDKSEKIHLISILKYKLIEIGATPLLEEIKPILYILEEYSKEKIAGKKLTNGIVHKNQISEDYNYYSCIPESVQEFKTRTSFAALPLDNTGEVAYLDSTLKHEAINYLPGNTYESTSQESGVEQPQSKQLNDEETYKLLSLYKQYQLNKTHKNAELTESSNILEELNLDDMLIIFKDFIEYVETLDRTDASVWCKEQFLKHAAKKDFDIIEIDPNTMRYLSDTFLEMNKSNNCTCNCKYPLPSTHKNPLEYYKLGCMIFDQSENVDNYLHVAPYLYKHKLSKINNLHEVRLHLPLITQFNDKYIFEKFADIFTYDAWDEIIKLFIKLKQGICLNCGESISIEGALSWSSLGMLMVKSIGPQNSSRLMTRYAAHIPNGDLDLNFYQSCILASTFGQSHLAVNFLEKVVNESTAQKFENLMETFLQRKYLGHQSVTISDGNTEVPKCSYCNLSLSEPIINEIKECECGHNFHSLCFICNNGICNICTT